MATRKSPGKRGTTTAVKPAAAPRTRSRTVKPPVVDAPTAPRQRRPTAVPTPEARYRWIAQAAYLRAEKRGFAPGHEVDDWLAAEADFVAAHPAAAD